MKNPRRISITEITAKHREQLGIFIANGNFTAPQKVLGFEYLDAWNEWAEFSKEYEDWLASQKVFGALGSLLSLFKLPYWIYRMKQFDSRGKVLTDRMDAASRLWEAAKSNKKVENWDDIPLSTKTTQ